MILLIDNYDSFTYNLYHYLGELGVEVRVYLNNKITLAEIDAMRPEKIVISPGPCTPKQAGISCDVVRRFGERLPILGVCLGHQAIGEAFGGKLVNLSEVYHGVATPIRLVSRESSVVNGKSNSRLTIHDSRNLFAGLPDLFDAGRYHSWIVSDENFPKELEVTARDENNFIMALQHKTYDVQGVQFHPESVLTPKGETILRNWLDV